MASRWRHSSDLPGSGLLYARESERERERERRERESLGRSYIGMRACGAVVPPVGVRQRLRLRSVNTQAAGGVRRDPPAARRAAGVAARRTSRARARPSGAAAGAITRGRGTGRIIALRGAGFDGCENVTDSCRVRGVADVHVLNIHYCTYTVKHALWADPARTVSQVAPLDFGVFDLPSTAHPTQLGSSSSPIVPRARNP